MGGDTSLTSPFTYIPLPGKSMLRMGTLTRHRPQRSTSLSLLWLELADRPKQSPQEHPEGPKFRSTATPWRSFLFIQFIPFPSSKT